MKAMLGTCLFLDTIRILHSAIPFLIDFMFISSFIILLSSATLALRMLVELVSFSLLLYKMSQCCIVLGLAGWGLLALLVLS
ncbi:hypothetical protein BJY01DRAFT_1827 [Aspergillus pseudoustus]|uniref:Uncharacterized protein n=1 Tax=Aspergillus pseudoustus TaxID=1810923 RepID=A0ABR4KT30_9EURO